MSAERSTPTVFRAARIASRRQWDGGRVMLCPVCGLVVPVWEANYVVDGRSVDHYPTFSDDAYGGEFGNFCRGSRHAAVRTPVPSIAGTWT